MVKRLLTRPEEITLLAIFIPSALFNPRSWMAFSILSLCAERPAISCHLQIPWNASSDFRWPSYCRSRSSKMSSATPSCSHTSRHSRTMYGASRLLTFRISWKKKKLIRILILSFICTRIIISYICVHDACHLQTKWSRVKAAIFYKQNWHSCNNK